MALQTLKMVYKPRYLALNVAIAIAYFYFIKYLIAFQDKGVFIASIPIYMLVILSITSAITFTIAIYSINNTRRNQAKITASTTSVLSVVASAMIGGCGCQVSILAGLAGIVAGASGAFALNVVLAENLFYIISAIVAINILLAIYYVNKLSKPACLISKGGGNAEQKRNKKG